MTQELNAHSLRGKRILVTGINGFLGKHVAKALLASGAIPVALLRPKANTEELADIGVLKDIVLLRMDDDFSNLDTLIKESGASALMHLASASRVKEDGPGIREMVTANILFPSLLLENMVRNKISRFVNVGSSWQSCDGSRFNPFNFYAATKQAIEDAALHFASLGVHSTTLRLFDTYGADDSRSKILNLIIRHTLTGVPLDMSPGRQKIHLVHVDDVADALVLQLTRSCPMPASHEVFDLPSSEAIALRDLADRIEAVVGKPCPINWGGRPYRQNEIMEPLTSNPLVPGFESRRVLVDELPTIVAVQAKKLKQENAGS
jgi:nucleoside-diphosphate-sugar epimerase